MYKGGGGRKKSAHQRTLPKDKNPGSGRNHFYNHDFFLISL